MSDSEYIRNLKRRIDGWTYWVTQEMTRVQRHTEVRLNWDEAYERVQPTIRYCMEVEEEIRRLETQTGTA